VRRFNSYHHVEEYVFFAKEMLEIPSLDPNQVTVGARFGGRLVVLHVLFPPANHAFGQ
jgi:hypothetical protein